MPEDLTDWNGHGTMVASMAGGKQFGVASKANLHLVKATNSFLGRDENGQPIIETPLYNDLSISFCFLNILHDIAAKRIEGKAVINMSIGKSTLPLPEPPAEQGCRKAPPAIVQGY